MVHRFVARTASILLILALLIPQADTPVAEAQTPRDDEIIYIDGGGVIRIIDPNVPGQPGQYQQITWSSPEGGWYDVAAGDFNNDGDMELVAIGNAKLTIFDPVVRDSTITPHGEHNLVPWARLFEMPVPGGAANLVGAGNLDAGVAGDEIIFGYSFDEGNNIKYRMTVLKRSDTQGLAWINHVSAGYGDVWKFLTVGNVNNAGSTDIVRIRDIDRRVEAREIDNNFNLIFERAGDTLFTYTAAAIGQLYGGGTGEVAIARTFQGTDQVPSLLIYSFSNNQWTILDEDALNYFPHLSWLFFADVNGNGDDELFWLRGGVPAGTPSPRLYMINRGGDPLPEFASLLDEDNGYTRGIGGDTDADGRDEVVLLRNNKILQFNAPEAGTTVAAPTGNIREWPNLSTNGRSLVLADVDGAGFTAGNRFAVDRDSINVSLSAGTSSPAILGINLSVIGVDTAIPFTVAKEGNAPWFTVSPPNGTTPASLFISGFDATQLAPGTYTDRIRITSTSNVLNQPFYIPITLNVTAVTFTLSQSSLSFSFRPGQTGAQQKSIAVNSDFPGLTYSATLVSQPAFDAATKALGETPRYGYLTESGDIVLTNGMGDEHRIEVTAEREVSAAAITWPSEPWATVQSVGNTMPDTITITAAPDQMDEQFEKAILLVIADERAGVYPNNIAIAEVFALNATDVSWLPRIFR